jgi:DNA-binding MarR family transcriptional regulator
MEADEKAMKEEQSIEDFIFDFIDQCKYLFYPEQWNNAFMDYSKNEIFAMLFVYRKGHANMTEIADYISVPLNTATGIISRLERRGMIKRERDLFDKRVVTIGISDEGREFLQKVLKELQHYFNLLMESITPEERTLLFGLVGKFLAIVSKDNAKKDENPDKKKTVRKITIE